MTKEKIIEIMENELECVRTASDNKCSRDCENCKLVRDSDDIIKAYDFVIKMLEKEPCEDAISRKEILKILPAFGFNGINDYLDAKNEIEKLPSVTPQPKTGHWIVKTYSTKMNDTYYGYECNQCHKEYNLRTNYCPNCGARKEP